MGEAEEVSGMLQHISLEEATLLFRKLEEERASVLCVGKLWGWELVLRGRVKLHSDREVAMTVGDTTELVLRLDSEGTDLWYAEPGKLPSPQIDSVPEDARELACIGVGLPLRIRPDGAPFLFREKLLFLEVK